MSAGRGTVRRHRLLDAAVEVVATSGLRGLTHRAVDARADLPEGTTSAYFRTRMALLAGLADHVAAKVSADVDRLAESLIEHTGDHEFAIDATQRLMGRWLEESTVLATRLELGIEAGRQPVLAATLQPWRDHLLDVIEQRMCQAGVGDARARAQTVVAGLDGVLMSALALPISRRRAPVMANTRMLLEALLTEVLLPPPL